jgi:glycine/D-amino acid oxidase-like deaminating enzyme
VITFTPRPRLLASPRGRDWPLLSDTRMPHDRPTVPPRTADIVIVGAGPAGMAVAAALWHRGIRDVVLLDRTGQPCDRFFRRVDLLRQRVLRSPYEHHPGVEGYWDCELADFARLHWALLTPDERREIRMSQAGHRSVVPVDVFEAFCRHVDAGHRIGARTWRGTVRELQLSADAVTTVADGFTVEAAAAVLCLGEERREAPSAWWGGGPPPPGVGFWDEPAPDADRLTVIGAGLSAAHLVRNALDDGARVHWIVRRDEERYQCADVDSTFFRPEGRARFDGVAWDERLALMRRYRRASVMFEFRPGLRHAEREGRLTVHRGRAVTEVASAPDGALVRLSDGGTITADHIALALGTTRSIGTGLLPDDAVGERDGWPDLDGATLAYQRAPRVFAVGAAAGMVLGPAARNIDGHRVATARVADAVARVVRGALGDPSDAAPSARARNGAFADAR